MNNYLEELEYIPKFSEKIKDKSLCKTNSSLKVMQINVGNLCNLACKHCHVEAGPNGKNIMSLDVMKDCLEVFRENNFTTLDITGGAPEMNPNFKWLVKEASKLGCKVIVRTNLVILTEKGYEDYPEFYRDNKVEVVSSLPYYSEKNTDKQRGNGVFEKSIKALLRLNEVGYGKEKDLILNLVYNPCGAFLPPTQGEMEAEYKKKLKYKYGIEFNNLFTITNNPVGRFGLFLKNSDNLEGYMKKLHNSFNSSTVEFMMCRDQISIGFDGYIYDCDFNQTLNWKIEGENHISNLKGKKLAVRNIALGNHCYACTAGSGSSCGGSTT